MTSRVPGTDAAAAGDAFDQRLTALSLQLLDGAAATVAVAAGPACYDSRAPFSPAMAYPECPWPAAPPGGGANHAYASVRAALRLLGLDAARFDTCEWNPLASVLAPGDTVVLKPNFVRDFRETRPGHDDCLVTHGAIIRAVLDYAYVALQGRGRIVIADAPQNDADFDAIRRIAGLDEIQAFYRSHAGFEVEVLDLRPERAVKIDGVIVGHEPLAGDPAGYACVNLAGRSAFADVDHLCDRLYGAEYDVDEVRRHHRGDVHEYLVSRTVLDADCVISLPKLKTHKKTGITVNMKNLVGMNGNKNWLPHHREGTPAQGGDQFADDAVGHRLERSVVAGFKRVFPWLGPLRPVVAGPAKALGKRVFGDTNAGTVRSGNWHGNDTTWRMVLDLNRILQYAGSDGRLHDRPVRRFFSVVDGIVGGEGNGPLDPTPKPSGVIVAGFNPVAVDLVCARLMGFDWTRMPMLHRALADHPLPLAAFSPADIVIRSNDGAHNGPLAHCSGHGPAFRPHFGWKGHIEALSELRETGMVS